MNREPARLSTFIRITLLPLLFAGVSACRSGTPIAPVAGDSSVVSGTVYVGGAATDQPLVGATVAVAHGGESWTATTSPRGYYSLSVPAGEVTITASKTGYASKSWSIDVDASMTINFSLASE